MTAVDESRARSVATLLNELTGLVFERERLPEVMAAVQRTMAGQGALSFDAFLDGLRSDQAGLDALVAELTVGETYFLREPRQFLHLRHELLPGLRRARGERPLRLWSAGCSTGEEAYSLSMLFELEPSLGPAQVLGTDISPRVLAWARKARYGAWSLRDEGAAEAKRFLVQAERQWQVIPEVRERVTFAFLNLASDAYPSVANGTWAMDLVLCRNVLIYFDRATVTRVARRLFDSLAPGGWLLLGASDPALQSLAPFDRVMTPAGVAYRRPLEVATVVPEPRPLAARLPLRAAVKALRPRRRLPASVLVAHDPRSPAEQARALANAGDLEAAEQVLAKALQRASMAAELHLLHAVVLAELNRVPEAVRAARRAVYVDRSLAIAHYTLAGALRKLGDTAGAEAAYRTARELAGKLPKDAIVPYSDGEPAGRLVAAATAQLALGRGP